MLFILLGISCLRAERIQPKSFWVYEDKSGELPFDEIQKVTDFKQLKTINFGYSLSVYWVKLPLKKYYDNEPYYAVASHAGAYKVDFFLSQNNKLLKSKLTGLAHSHQDREILTDRYFMKIIPDTNQVLYVRFQDVGASIHNNIYFQSSYDFFRGVYFGTAFYWLYAGAVLLIVLYCLINYFMKGRRLFLYYGFFVLSITTFTGFKSDHLYFILPYSWIAITHQLRFFLLIPIIVAWLLYSYSFLLVEEIGKSIIIKVYRVLLYAFPLYILLIFFDMPTHPYRFVFLDIFFVMVLAAFALTIYSGWLSVQNGHRPARYFLFGQIPLITLYCFYVLRNYGLTSNTEASLYMTPIFQAWEMLVMFVCMERHFNYERVIEIAVGGKLPEQTVLENISQKKIERDKAEIEPETLALYNEVVTFFDTEKIYLNSELKISDVADKLSVAAYQISKCINSCSDMHFFDFVNSYRIETAKEMMSDEELNRQYTVEYIAQKCGFNNKVSFNNAFKKFTGMTPTQYKTQRQAV